MAWFRSRVRIYWVAGLAFLMPICLSASESPSSSTLASARAANFLREAEALRAHAQANSSRQAILYFKRAAAFYRVAGDRVGGARALASAASALVEVSRFAEALTIYEQVLRVSRAGNITEGEFSAVNGLSHTYFEMGEPAASLAAANRARVVSDKLGVPLARAEALISAGRAQFLFSNDPAALADFREALLICHSEQDQTCEANVLDGIGWTYTDMGDLSNAIAFEKQAIAMWRGLGNLRAAARAEKIMGNIYSWMGDREKALALHQKTLHVFQQSGDLLWAGFALNDLGWDYDTLDADLAADYYRRALHIFRAIRHRAGQVEALGNLCVFYRSQQKLRTALQICRERNRLIHELGDPRREAVAAHDTGRIFQDLGDLSRALQQYDLALHLSRRAGDPRGEGEALRQIGGVQILRGQAMVAVETLGHAATLSRQGSDPEGEAAALSDMARAHIACAHPEQARVALEAALTLVETLRGKAGNPMLRAAYFASVRRYYDDYIDVLMQLHRGMPQHGFDVLAFEASERSRARSLLDFVGAARAMLPTAADGDARVRSQQAQIEDTVRRLTELPTRSAQRRGLEEQLRQLQTEMYELVAVNRLRGQATVVDTKAYVATLSEIQSRLLDEESILLQYSLGQDRGYLWVVSKNAFTSYQLPAQAQIRQMARELRELLTAPQLRPGETSRAYLQRLRLDKQAYIKAARGLANLLLLPAADRLEGKRLVISPDGVLEYIPFAALPLPESSTQHPIALAEKFELLSIPSASTLAVLRSSSDSPPAMHKIVVFADPVFESDDPRVRKGNGSQLTRKTHGDLSELGLILRSADLTSANTRVPRLPGTRQEAEAIARIAKSSRVALDFDANLSAATEPDLVNYQILHFATHGVLNTEHPELSGIILSLVDKDGRPQEGYLRLHHVYNLKLSADLVVLSACNSALGRQVLGEGVMGISRGFFFAGAKRVVSSLWKVDDEATSQLMSFFYEGMLQGGKTASASLHDAQLEIAKQKRWNFPYYWAGFVLQGDWR